MVADMVANMEVDMVPEMELDMVADDKVARVAQKSYMVVLIFITFYQYNDIIMKAEESHAYI